MFKKKKIFAVIPARGGSKGVPRKNIRMAGGKPLIAWMIEAAQKSKYIDRLILSSDDDEIIRVAESYGCEAPFIRPQELASDESSSVDVILHALKQIPGYDYVALLQPTSPLTLPRDIDNCITSCISSKVNAVVSITEPDKNPYWMFTLGENKQLMPLLEEKYLKTPRQQLPDVYLPTGAVYISQTDWFVEHKTFYSNNTMGIFIPRERSLDIDVEDDFKLLEVYLNNK